MISAIVAVDSNYGIGYKNNLLFHIKEDLKHFKELTTGNIVIMGRKTYESLPIKPLPNRVNIIITNNVSAMLDKYENNTENTIFTNLDMLKKSINSLNKKNDIYVIGGSQIYKELLPYCERIYLTRVYKSFEEVDSYFPDINIDNDWQLTESSDVKQIDDLKYQFCIYDKVSYAKEVSIRG